MVVGFGVVSLGFVVVVVVVKGCVVVSFGVVRSNVVVVDCVSVLCTVVVISSRVVLLVVVNFKNLIVCLFPSHVLSSTHFLSVEAGCGSFPERLFQLV